MTETETRALATRGAANLDTLRPGWHIELADKPLRIDDSTKCVVGWLVPGVSWESGCNILGFCVGFISNPLTHPMSPWMNGLGGPPVQLVTKSDKYIYHHYAILQLQWEIEIASRLAADAATISAETEPVEQEVLVS